MKKANTQLLQHVKSVKAPEHEGGKYIYTYMHTIYMTGLSTSE